jgi:hypothetical protein
MPRLPVRVQNPETDAAPPGGTLGIEGEPVLGRFQGPPGVKTELQEVLPQPGLHNAGDREPAAKLQRHPAVPAPHPASGLRARSDLLLVGLWALLRSSLPICMTTWLLLPLVSNETGWIKRRS